MHNLSENCKQSAKFETIIQSELYSKNPNTELDSFLLNGKMKYKISSIISDAFMDIQDEDTVSSDGSLVNFKVYFLF